MIPDDYPNAEHTEKLPKDLAHVRRALLWMAEQVQRGMRVWMHIPGPTGECDRDRPLTVEEVVETALTVTEKRPPQ